MAAMAAEGDNPTASAASLAALTCSSCIRSLPPRSSAGRGIWPAALSGWASLAPHDMLRIIEATHPSSGVATVALAAASHAILSALSSVVCASSTLATTSLIVTGPLRRIPGGRYATNRNFLGMGAKQ